MTLRANTVARHLLALFASALALVAARAHAGEPEPQPAAQVTALRIGLSGAYRLGCWTSTTIEILGGTYPATGTVEVTAPDPDGVPVHFTAPFGSRDEWDSEANLYLRICQESAPITVRLLDDKGQVLDARTFIPHRTTLEKSTSFTPGLSATDKLVVTFGARTDLAAELVRADNDAASTATVHSVLVEAPADLPTQWYGYESVDTVILGSALPKQFADAKLLAPRIAALNRWVELGGRLVIFCGAESADLLAEGGALAPLLPGRYAGEIVALPDNLPLEIFSGAATELPHSEDRLRVPRLVDATGRLLAQGPSETPLALRARRGLGEVTFVAIDPDAEPFASWTERTNLLRQALRWPAPSPNATPDRGATNSGPADLVNQLRSALDQQFHGVATAQFGLVALLVLGYVALIGPADYFLLKAIKRPLLTWLTFPLVVIASCAGAYALAHRMKGDELHVNQVEIVDVDVTGQQARGTVWSHLFNPQVERYNLCDPPLRGA